MLISRSSLLAVLLVVSASPALARDFGLHDFSGNAEYPNLAARATSNRCVGCHSPKMLGMASEFGNDFPGGIAVVTDPDYRIVRDDGVTVGPRRNPSLPSAMICLGCHDGVIHTSSGVDHMPTPEPWSMGIDLNWGAGGAHNIWMMGQDSAFHPVEIHYPPDPDEKMWAGFRTLYINGDNNRVLVNGTWTIVDPTLSAAGLPLVTDPADPSKGYISCVTCHIPHGAGEVGDFLRADWPNLCFMCHRRSQTPLTASAPAASLTAPRALSAGSSSADVAKSPEAAANDRAAWKKYFWELSGQPSRE